MNPALDLALAYAELGWQVFPVHTIPNDGRACSCKNPGGPKCSPGKHPRTNRGLKDATDDEAQVRKWWTKWPDSNIGIACGERSGMWVLDVDIRFDRETGEVLVDGEASLAKLAGSRPIPETVEAKTGGGGRHLVFAWDDEVPVGSPKVNLPGIDIKGDGGYVLVDPSRHALGDVYSWVRSPLDHALVAPPSWLLKFAVDPKGSGDVEPERAPRPATNGTGNGTAPEWSGKGLVPVPLSFEFEGDVDPEVVEAMRWIPSNLGYDAWIAVAMGLHDETAGSADGLALFDAWSATATGATTPSGRTAYEGGEHTASMWRSLKATTSGRSRATIFAAANEHGFDAVSWRAGLERAPGSAPDASGASNGVDLTSIGHNGVAAESEPPEPTWPWRRPTPMPFPVESAFPPQLGWLRRFFEKLAWTYQVPVDLPVLLGAPIAMATLAGKVEVKVPGERWTEPAVLWTICAMTSGAGKSPVHRDLIAPVTKWEAKLAPVHNKARAAHTAKVQIAEIEVRRAVAKLGRIPANQATEKEKAQEALSRAAEDLEAAKNSSVQLDNIVASEATSERLVSILAECRARTLVSDAEGDVFDVAMGRYSRGEPNLGPWLKGYDGDTIKQQRIGGDRTVQNPLINVGVATQPEALSFLSDSIAQGRGFVARFAAAVVRPLTGREFMPGRDMDDSEFEMWNETITRLLDITRPDKPTTVVLSDGAAAAFKAWGSENESSMDTIHTESGEDPRTAWFRKYPGKVLRIALLLHGLQCEGDVFAGSPIDVETMEAAIVWGRYLASHNAFIEHTVSMSQEMKVLERIMRWVEYNSPDRIFTRREVLRGLQSSYEGASVRTVAEIVGPLDSLVELGWIVPTGKTRRSSVPGPTSFAPIDRYVERLEESRRREREMTGADKSKRW